MEDLAGLLVVLVLGLFALGCVLLGYALVLTIILVIVALLLPGIVYGFVQELKEEHDERKAGDSNPEGG